MLLFGSVFCQQSLPTTDRPEDIWHIRLPDDKGSKVDTSTVWCQFQQGGLLEMPMRIWVHTNGNVLAQGDWRIKESRFFEYQTKLCPEEERLLADLIQKTDFMNRPRGRCLFTDSGNWSVFVRQDGKTNEVFFNPDDSELCMLAEFFRRIAIQAADSSALTYRHYCNPNKNSFQRWLQPEKAVIPLKEYFKICQKLEDTSLALQSLAKVISAEEWAKFVSQSLDGADTNSRKRILNALNSNAIPLQGNISKQHREALQPVLKKWNP